MPAQHQSVERPFGSLQQNTILAGRYRIERFIARGGMGHVYQADDMLLRQTVALKTVSHHAFDSVHAATQHLMNEVAVAQKVSHENVCRIFDIGPLHESAEGVLFLTMQYIDGPSLKTQHDTGPGFSIAQALKIGEGILRGLDAIHTAGVLHLDLKAENILMASHEHREFTPMIADFGLSGALEPNTSRIANEGSMVGSLAYMSPEQLEGSPLRVSADLYSFGVVLFELLTDRLPFIGTSPVAGAVKRLLEPAPRMRYFNPEISPALDALVARCLERDPRARYASADEALAALQETQTQRPKSRFQAVRRNVAWEVSSGAYSLESHPPSMVRRAWNTESPDTEALPAVAD